MQTDADVRTSVLGRAKWEGYLPGLNGVLAGQAEDRANATRGRSAINRPSYPFKFILYGLDSGWGVEQGYGGYVPKRPAGFLHPPLGFFLAFEDLDGSRIDPGLCCCHRVRSFSVAASSHPLEERLHFRWHGASNFYAASGQDYLLSFIIKGSFYLYIIFKYLKYFLTMIHHGKLTITGV